MERLGHSRGESSRHVDNTTRGGGGFLTLPVVDGSAADSALCSNDTEEANENVDSKIGINRADVDYFHLGSREREHTHIHTSSQRG